ncbi:hypothetical protein D3C87_2137310 [compost metagenome]
MKLPAQPGFVMPETGERCPLHHTGFHQAAGQPDARRFDVKLLPRGRLVLRLLKDAERSVGFIDGIGHLV